MFEGSSRHRTRARSLGSAAAALAAAGALVLGMVGSAAAASPAASAGGRTLTLTRGATTHITASRAPASRISPNDAGSTEISPNDDVTERTPKVGAPQVNPPSTPPSVAGKKVSFGTSGATGFNGLSHVDSRTASGGNQFSLEPPDQGLCVGNGFEIETINDVLAVYHGNGTLVAGPTALNAFLGYAPSINRTTGAFGQFVTDPKCYFDADTQRWYHTDLTLEQDPTSGALTGATHVDIAVSQTNDPTGAWTIFHLDTTNGDGSLANHPGCPCLGDQPLLGFDATGLYITTNEFSVNGPEFNGAQVYATSKWKLAAAADNLGSPGVVVSFDGLPLAEGQAYSVQPADSVGGYATANNGTEYFLSALQFGPAPLDNRIAIWSLTGTKSLGGLHPKVKLQSHVMKSEVYGQPDPAVQRNGLLQLNTSLTVLNSNDDRMNQVVFANGLLWSGVNTKVTTKDGSTRVGIAFFAVQPEWNGSTLGGHVHHQGYVAVNGQNVLFPAIGVDKFGNAVMTFTLVGPKYYPSAAYLRLNASSTAGTIHVIGDGVGPADGFTGDPAEGAPDNVERWGDYSAAVADSSGHIWVATEYIPNGPRTLLANWGTFVARVSP
jgi:hypothetical protein